MGNVYEHAVRYRWWVILGVLALSVASAVYFTAQETPVYETSAAVTVVPAAEVSDAADIMRGLETLERRTVVATFAMIPEARETRALAAERLGLSESEMRRYRVDASVVPSTNTIRIVVAGPDGERASEVANTVARLTEEQARQMYRIFAMQPLEAAVPSRRAVHPDPARNYVVAAILGLLVGFAAAVAMEYLWPSRPRVAAAPAPAEPRVRVG